MAMTALPGALLRKENVFRRYITTPLGVMATKLRGNFWLDSTVVMRTHTSNIINRKAVTALIDSHGFDGLVCTVAASGFLTDSYNLFATNVILPSLGYVYWPGVTDSKPELKINGATLGGSVIGMLLFGYLADRYGRRKLYGIELIIVIFGTIGVVQASAGYDGSMDIMGWLIFWRFFMGVGIGAEYPLSAVITAEFAPKLWRARMMATVFLMQSVGQLLAAVINLGVVLSIGANHGLQDLKPDDAGSRRWVDTIWRTVIGVGGFPALVAIIFRLTIPESPRYTLDVDHDGYRALQDTQEYFHGHSAQGGAQGNGSQIEMSGGLPAPHADSGDAISIAPQALADEGSEGSSEQEGAEYEETEEDDSDSTSAEGRDNSPKAFSKADLYDYFITKGSWRFLAGTSSCWFILDFAFYGLGINSPRQIARIWEWQPLPNAAQSIPDWQTTDTTKNIYQVLVSDAIQYIITISIGSVLGSLLLIKFIDYFPRKALLSWTFIFLAGLFAIVGGSLFVVEYTNLHAITITLYVLCQLLFNLGPNTLTFIISAEIFPTRYRCTCHGISAASGKLGSIFVQIVLSQDYFSSPKPLYLAVTLLTFSAFMASGAFFSWIWLPDMQDPRAPNGKNPGDVENREVASSVNVAASHGAGGADQSGGDGSEEGIEDGSAQESLISKKSWMDAYKIPSKSLEELAEGYQSTIARGQNLGFRRKLGIYNFLQPMVEKIQEWLSNARKKQETKEE